jgi:hypothetical protein
MPMIQRSIDRITHSTYSIPPQDSEQDLAPPAANTHRPTPSLLVDRDNFEEFDVLEAINFPAGHIDDDSTIDC